MAYRQTLEEFEDTSRTFELLLQGCFDPEQMRDWVSHVLAIWGHDCREVFNGYYDHIVTLEGGSSGIVECKPFFHSRISFIMATAHECSAYLVEMLYLSLFPENFPVEMIDDKVRRNLVDEKMDEIVSKVNGLLPYLEYAELLKVAARMNRERALVMANPPEWVEESHPEDGFFNSQLLAMTHLTSNTLNKYRKKAGVPIPKIGERNFTQSPIETRTLLKHMVDKGSRKKIRDDARDALEGLK